VTFRAEGIGNGKFSYWTGLPTLADQYAFTVSSDMTIGAVFYLNGSDPVHRLTPGTITGDGTIYISIEGGVWAIFDMPVTLIEGTSVTFRAVAGKGYAFKDWSGDVSGTADTITFTVMSDMTISAEFSSTKTDMPCWIPILIMLFFLALAILMVKKGKHRPYRPRHVLGLIHMIERNRRYGRE
jgi:hypothetical protein